MKWELTQASPGKMVVLQLRAAPGPRLVGPAEEGMSVRVVPSPPLTALQARLQSGLGLEIRLCLLHYAFAQGSLSGEAH